ncbi:MAG: hypothetical protein ABWY05_17485 [Noviherbaspirillum sp.]
MEILPRLSVLYYCLFSIFVYYQRVYADSHVGDGWRKLVLTGTAFLGMLTGFAYLVYCGWKIVWWAPVIPLGMSVLATIPAILVERLVGRQALGRISLAWPLWAYLMFDALSA